MIKLNFSYKNFETITVNNGEELFTVSTKDTVACFNAIKPRTIEKSLKYIY